jgi:hypothetical protein
LLHIEKPTRGNEVGTDLICCVLEPDPVLTGRFDIAAATARWFCRSLVGELPGKWQAKHYLLIGQEFHGK